MTQWLRQESVASVCLLRSRSDNLKRHLKNVPSGRVNIIELFPPSQISCNKSSGIWYWLNGRRIQEPENGLYTKEKYEETMDTLDARQVNQGLDCIDVILRAEPEDGLYTKEEFEETMNTLRVRFPTMNFDTIDPRFMHPFTAIIAGPSSSGKSMFCMRLIRNARECIAPPPERIVYCYSVYQHIFDQYPNVEFVEGLPDLNMFDGVKRTLLIIDDLMHETNEYDR